MRSEKLNKTTFTTMFQRKNALQGEQNISWPECRPSISLRMKIDFSNNFSFSLQKNDIILLPFHSYYVNGSFALKKLQLKQKLSKITSKTIFFVFSLLIKSLLCS